MPHVTKNQGHQIKILAIDTATDACSVALKIGENPTQEIWKMAPKCHSELILPMVKKILHEAKLELSDLDLLAFSQGPGSFTGIRLTTSIAQGLCYGANLKAMRISTLQAMAEGAHREYGALCVCVAHDARMGEIYFGLYKISEKGLMQPSIDDICCSPTNVPLAKNQDPKEMIAVGNAWDIYPELVQSYKNINLTFKNKESVTHALDIANLAYSQYHLAKTKLINAHEILPVYLQNDMYKK